MKPHLPVSLFKMLLVAYAVVCSTSEASRLSSNVSFITYTDFGQNLGRYKTDATANALLLHLRETEGGVKIAYQNGDSYTLDYYMPDFTGAKDHTATDMSLGYNATVTVKHNGVFNGSFTSSAIGTEHGIFYQGIEYRHDPSSTFLHAPASGFDHKVTRVSKVITDVQTATLYSGTSEDFKKNHMKEGELLYRAGSGTMYLFDTATNTTTSLTGANVYVTGGIDKVDRWVVENGSEVTLITNPAYNGTAPKPSDEPLPFGITPGDSGSPTFIYNTATKQYEFIAAASNGEGGESWHKGSIDYVRAQQSQYDKVVTTTADAAELHIGEVSTPGKEIKATVDTNHEVSTKPCSGWVTDANGGKLKSFVGVSTGISTWSDLSGLKDTANWYAYDNKYLNATPYAEGGKALTYADLFKTENLVFEAKTAKSEIVLDATVDLGIGYAQFVLGTGQESARFDISSGGDGSYQFNHAGYVIGKDVEVHTTLTGSAGHMYEWRKVGEGNLHIEGAGANNILLNVGGKGKTYLNRTKVGESDYYAAYNVLANTGATVVITDTSQIARDFTFGHEGGVLDMNGNSMEWNNSQDAAAEGFTIHALDEQAIVANLKGDSSTTLTWTQGGNQTFLGSFQDNGADSQLQFIYNGGKDSKLTLHSIRTSLKATGSGMIVESGTLALAGTRTVHGQGSLNGRSAERYSHEDDWHYADATGNVTVKNGGTFELDSHARLTGDVHVQSGGTFIMREGVRHELEYIEGGEKLESTSAIAAYHGLKGKVSLDDGATLEISANTGTTAICSYNDVISGAGNVVVNHADMGSGYSLGGANTFSGSKTIKRGGLIAEKLYSLGDVSSNKWKVEADGWIAAHEGSAGDLLDCLDSSSSGALALSADSSKLDLSSHLGLHIGAETGKVVNYGAVGTTEALDAVDGAWRFGGGGGELRVNYQLSGTADLLVHGAPECTIVLNHEANNFEGTITVQGGLLQTKDQGHSVTLGNDGRIHYTDVREGQHSISHVSGTGSVGLKFTDDIEKNVLNTDGASTVAVHLLAGGVTINQESLTRSLILENGTRIRLGQETSAVNGASLTAAGKAELHGGDYMITLGVLSGAGELVNKATGLVSVADMSGLAAFTHDSAGHLEIQGGTVQSLTQKAGTATLAESVKTTSLTVNGGKLYVYANKENLKRLSGSITVDGGELYFGSGYTSDTLDYNDSNGVINVANGTLDFGTTRQTMGSWKLVLGDGATVAGQGQGNGAMDFNLSGSTIYATNGNSTISAETRIRTEGLGNNAKNNLNFDVGKDATLTVSGCIQADAKSTEKGQITKKGDGTLVLTAYNFYNGGTTISGGTLRTSEMENLGTGAISIATGARLEITAQSGVGERTANITGGGTLDLAFAQDSSLTVNLGSGFAGGLDISGKGTLKMGSGSSLKENVSVSNGATLAFGSTGTFNANGKTLSVTGGVVDFGATSQTMGSWQLELAGGAHLTGAGEKDDAMDFNVPGSTIFVTSGENTISATTRLRATQGNLNLNYNVSKDATLTVSGLIQADGNQLGRGSITKLGEGTLVLTGANTYAGTTAVDEGALHINGLSALGSSWVWLAEGANLRIENTTDPKALASGRIGGFGTLELLLSTEYGNTLSLGTSFGGETYIRGGNMTLNGAQAGKALRLAGGANLQFNEKETAAWGGNLVLEGKSEVRANDGSDFTLNGSVSGSGTYVSQGSGNVNFKGDVTLAGFEQTSDNDSLVANFNGTTKIGSMKVSKGAVHLNGKTQLGTMTISGGTVQIANEVELNGSNRMDIQSGGRLLLADGALLNRTTNVSSWIRGSLVVQKEADARLVSKDDVHVSYNNGNNQSTIQLEENSSLEIDVKGLYFYTGNRVELESGSELTLTQSSASISNSGAETTTLIASNVGATSSQQYSMGNANFELTAGHLKATSSAAAELGNKLTRSSLENAGTGTLTVKNAANTITSLKATGGDVMLADDMSVQRISAANGKSVSVAGNKGITMAGGVSLKAGVTEAATLTALSDSALAGLQDGTSFTIRDMVLEHATLTASNDATNPVMMQNVGFSQVVLNQGAFTLRTAAPTVSKAESGNTLLSYTTGISGITNGATLTLMADLNMPAGNAVGLVDLEFVFTGFNTGMEYATGSLAGLKEAYGIEFGGILGNLLNQPEPVVAAETLRAGESTATTTADTFTVSYGAGTGAQVGSLVITIAGLNVPEPATGTLSLLALAALAARRRRK